MSTSASQATKAPVDVTLGGKTYQFSPLEQVDYGAFANWVRQQFLDTAKEATKGLNDKQAEGILKHAYDRAMAINIDSPETLERMATFDGACKLAHLMVAKLHPDLTLDELKKILWDNPDDVAKSMDAYDLLHPEKKRKKVQRQQTRKVKRKK